MTEVQKSMALFSGSVNPELADEIAKHLNASLGNVKLEKKRLNWRGQTLRFQAHLLMSIPIFAWRKRGFRLM